MPPLPHPDDGLRGSAWGGEPGFVAFATADVGARPRQRVADLGCGRGLLSAWLLAATSPGGRVDGFDLDPEQVARARARFRRAEARPRFQVGDAAALDAVSGASYDGVACMCLLAHQSDPGRVLAEMRRIARPGAWILGIEPDHVARVAGEWVDEPTLVDRATAVEEAIARGAAATGAGRYRAGRDLEDWLAGAGLTQVRGQPVPDPPVLTPPYGPREWALAAALERSWREEAADEDARRALFVAGGGGEPEWAEWTRIEARIRARRLEALRRGTLAHRPSLGLRAGWGRSRTISAL